MGDDPAAGRVSDPADRWPLLGADADGLREELLAAWAEPTRRYHDTRHLGEVLDRLAELEAAGAAYPRLPVLLAAWFHDAVYDGERDAEERSAAWSEAALPGLVEDAVVAEVARLVRLTETHAPGPDDAAGAALCDADLAILAAPTERYAQYAAAVRAEYAHLGDADFAAGRAHLLEQLAAAPTLFHTAPARDAWETPARANLAAELARLRG